MALNFPSNPSVGDEFTGGGFTWVWTGTTWSKLAASTGGAANDFALQVGTSSNTTYILDRTYTSGRYTISFVNGDTTYDIYFIAEDGTYAGYTSGTVAQVSANFAEVVVLGAANNETILFTYQGTLTSPTSAGDVSVAGAFINSVVTSALPNIDDSTVVNGGNFAANVTVSFIGQDDVEIAAKTVVRTSSTQLVVTRPDALSPAQSPYTIKVTNPGIPVPTGTNSHLLTNAVTAGTAPTWVTTSPIYFNLGNPTTITLVATDTENSDIDYTIESGTLPSGLSFDGETGVISGTYSGSAVEGDTTEAITVRATDAGGNFIDRTFTPTANAAPTITTIQANIPKNYTDGFVYSYQLQHDGGTVGTTITYSLTAGALPGGLSLSSSGLISGTSTETAEGTDTFTVRVTDQYSNFSETQFTITTAVPIAASGGTESTSGGYKYHVFNSSGTFTVTSGGDMEILVVSGGGAGQFPGTYTNSYGGGGGGSIVSSETVAAGSITVTVGGSGTQSSFGATTVTAGGTPTPGLNGGAGGFASQGSPGNDISGLGWAVGPTRPGGGGGGAPWTGSTRYSGGFQGGGTSAAGQSFGDPTPGEANTGGGGGGGIYSEVIKQPAQGGSGVVIVRYAA